MYFLGLFVSSRSIFIVELLINVEKQNLLRNILVVAVTKLETKVKQFNREFQMNFFRLSVFQFKLWRSFMILLIMIDEMTVYYMTVTEYRKRAGVEPLNSSSRNETKISKLSGQEY